MLHSDIGEQRAQFSIEKLIPTSLTPGSEAHESIACHTTTRFACRGVTP